MCDDTQIQALLDEIRSPDAAPLLRRKALSRLLLCIQRSPKLRRSRHPDYGHALSLTLEWVCRAIDEFSPRSDSVSHDLINWVNGYLNGRLMDLRNPDESIKELYRPEREERRIKREFGGVVVLDQCIGEDSNQTSMGDLTADPRQEITLLEAWIETQQQAQKQRIGQQVWQYLETDPDGILHGCHPRKCPDCNCHALVRLMLLSESPQTIRDIAKTAGTPEQTLYAHWPKKCLLLLEIIGLRFDPAIVAYVQNDPIQCLGNCHLPNQAHCNCRDLAKRLLLSAPPESMGAIARDLNIKESALAKHWRTQCLPLLKKQRL
ncbi:MAG: hypothetical protein Fur0046_00820 [Cyanobacteria bacterium J069]|nr:MAG: TetR family transcriptional regulator [Cyanobacteria bacterium J069]